MAGKLIVLEGLDGSGKTTQLACLLARLSAKKLPARRVKLPNYESEACAPIKMYLRGDFGSNPGDVNAYAASAFYAVDRFASYQLEWKSDYLGGAFILCDRYATSNLYHQATKLPRAQWAEFTRWAEELEYERMGIPKPDLVIYLDMPLARSQSLLCERYHGDEQRKDIHERDLAYLALCREAALFAAENLGWTVLPCTEGERMLSIEELSERIFACAAPLLEETP